MNSPSPLTGETQRTFQAIIENGPAQDVTWTAVRALLAQLGHVAEGANGNLMIARHGHWLELHPALTKDAVESGELPAIRHFLEDSETIPAESTGRDPHLLLVIQGPEARLFRCQVMGGVPQLVLPYEVAEPNPEQPGARKAPRPPKVPMGEGLFTAIAEELQIAGQIVVFGTDGEAAKFVAWLGNHDSELSGRIIGVRTIGEGQLTGDGLLLAAREFYATVYPAAPASAAVRPGPRPWSGPRADWPAVDSRIRSSRGVH